MEASSYRGKLFGVPYQSRQLVLYVNKSLFQGLSLPLGVGQPQLDVGALPGEGHGPHPARLRRGYPPVRNPGHRAPLLGVLIRQNGGQEFNREMSRSFYDAPEAHEALQWAADLDLALPGGAERAAEPQRQQLQLRQRQRGDVGLVPALHPPRLAAGLHQLRLGHLPPPQQEAGDLRGLGLPSLSANPVDVDRAWEFLRFLAGPEGDALALREGVAGPLQRGTEPVFPHRRRGDEQGGGDPGHAAGHGHPSPARGLGPDRLSAVSFYLRGVFAGNEKASTPAGTCVRWWTGSLAGLEAPKAPAVGNAGAEEGAERGGHAMIIVMRQGASERDVAEVIARVESTGFRPSSTPAWSGR